jgi:hypothetical protein
VASVEELDGVAGENLALEAGRTPDKIYVPVPARDEVFVLEKDDLLEVRTFEAEESPARVALDRSPGTPGVFYTLSEDGSAVTAMDLTGAKEVLTEVRVDGGEDSLIEVGAGEGFWVTGSETVALYERPSFKSSASLELEAVALAADAAEARAYVAEAGSGRVLAVEPGSDGSLEVVANRDVGAQARYLEPEEDRLYAATDDKLVVLDGEDLKPIASVDLEPALNRESIAEVNLSGLAIGEERVFLTLEGKPYVLLVRKP